RNDLHETTTIVRNNNRIESGAEGETGSFSCSALSVPHAMSVSWSFNGADINVDSGQYAIQENLSSNEVESTLIIKKIYPEDFGSYTCTVRMSLASHPPSCILGSEV
ncbi:Nephrinlike, partial [Caligus rogercresseyi]